MIKRNGNNEIVITDISKVVSLILAIITLCSVLVGLSTYVYATNSKANEAMVQVKNLQESCVPRHEMESEFGHRDEAMKNEIKYLHEKIDMLIKYFGLEVKK